MIVSPTLGALRWKESALLEAIMGYWTRGAHWRRCNDVFSVLIKWPPRLFLEGDRMRQVKLDGWSSV
jgi:hypothetical protein